MDLKKLQNGSDIRGIALGENMNLTTEAANKLAAAFALWLGKKTEKKTPKIAIGMDSRVTGPDLRQACIQGLTEEGADVLDFTMASTPAMFMATVLPEANADGSIMITASHLPMDRNGMKFFTKDGGLEKDDIAAIIEIAEAGTAPVAEPGAVEKMDFMSIYADHLAKIVRDATGKEKPLEGLHIIVDAGNGAGGFYAAKVLEPLGADTTGSQFLEPDGHFPNHIPNPENEDAMNSIVAAVKDSGADFGVIFDTDVDRAGAVDKGGIVLNRDRLIAAISAILLKEHPGTTIVTDSVTSASLGDFIEARGGNHHRFKRGYRNVINESMRLNNEGTDSQLAIETSGHAALKENYFLDDGAYLVTRLIIELSRLREQGSNIADLIADLVDPVESHEFRLPLLTDDFKVYGTDIIAKCADHYAGRESEGITIVPKNYEGVRVAFGPDSGDGWFLLRLSLHEPLMPLNVQSNEKGGVLKIVRDLYDFLLQFPALNLSGITDYIR